jgi:cilia- and flagella-associated protein 57
MERPTDEVDYEYLVHPFHQRGINGMDVCIKKPFVATCSMDKTVKVWSYKPQTGFNLEVDQGFAEEAYCVAFHPSGFHLVVGFADRIRMMNVFEKTLLPYKDIPIKQCREIVFSHGGHLLAC